MPLTPEQEAALKKFAAERQAYDNTPGVMLRSGSIGRDVAGDAGISSIDAAMQRNAQGGGMRPSTPEELAILNQAKQGVDQSNFVRAARGGLLDAQPQQQQATTHYPRRTTDTVIEANNIPPKMGGGIGNLLSNIFGGGGSSQQAQAQPQQPAQPQQQAPQQQGGQNWAQALLEGFGAGAQGMSVPQMRLMQAQAKMQQFEVQQQMRIQRAQQAVPAFKQKMPSVAKFAQQAFKDRVKEAKAQGLPVPIAMSAMDLDEGSRRHDKTWEGVPEMQITEVDQDVMTLLPQGRQFTAELGILPFEEQNNVNSQAQQAIIQERMRIQKEMSDSLQVANLFDRIEPLGPQQSGKPLGGELIPNDRLSALAEQRGVTPEQLAGQLTNAPIQNQLNPRTGSIDGQSIGRIPDSLVGSGFNQSKLPLLKQLTEQENTGAQAMAGLPADMIKTKTKEEAAIRLEEQRAIQREKLATQKSAERIKQIDRQGEIRKDLQSQETTTRKTLMQMQADLNNDRDRAKGQERMAELKYKIDNRAESTATTPEERKALALLNGAMAGDRVAATNAAKAARQLAAMSATDEKTVFQALVNSGAVAPADLMEAAKRADKEAELNPEKAGSLTHGVFAALQEIQAERALDPFTDDIDFALGAKGKPEKVGELTRLINRWETRRDKEQTPEGKAIWESGIKKAEAAMQRLDTSTGSSKARGNALFESSSQAVKDILLSKPGDLMHNATSRDVMKAIDENQQNKVEVAVGRFTALEDQKNVKAAGEIFGIIDKFKALGQDLFTDNTFLRLSGLQSGKINIEALAQKDPRVKEYLRLRKGLAGQLSRTVGGERGMMTEGDIERAMELIPDPTDLFPDSLETFNTVIDGLESMVTQKVRARYDQRAIDALRGGTTGEQAAASGVEDILAEARRRVGVQ